LTCEVCSAPALPAAGRCAFCRSPLAAEADTSGLLDYLAGRLPAAHARRRGLLRRGPVRELRIRAAGAQYRARLRQGRLELEPDLPPAEWADRLLGDLSRDAAADGRLRSTMTRAGWALR
jgi:hypothetical protein